MRMKIEVQNYRGQKIKEQKLQLNTERAKTTQCLKHLLLLLIMMIKKLQHYVHLKSGITKILYCKIYIL